MCGIAGIMTRDGRNPDGNTLDRLTQALLHRGPDGSGRHVAGDTGLVQTRLAIIDLETGDQPLFEPGGAALVANGEIYNYIELRESLTDIRPATRSDCEPPLHLYRRKGLDFVHDLRGMYAIAIHDPGTRQLILTRDPFGIKPLYYAETSTCFAFASEPRALIAAGLVDPVLEDGAVNELLQLQFTCGEDTIYRGIRRVLPGETLVICNGMVAERRRFPALPDGGAESISTDDALTALDRALEDSVRVHQRSDVPYGLFLSGGIDSSTVLAMMARLNSQPVATFTAGFSGTDVHDERPRARAVAAACGADHQEVDFSEEDFWALLPKIASDIDDPVADYAALPTWKLARSAAQELKVVLCGEGGDELFAGYGRYRRQMRPWWLGGRSIRSKGIFDGLGVLRQEGTGWRAGIDASLADARGDGRSPLQAAQAADCADWLPNDLLTKVDRCLMSHGLEGRTPFIDPAVASFAFRLPDRLKIRDGRGKWLLRRWFDGALPDAGAFERKRGFTVPVGEWIRRRGEALGPIVAAYPAVHALCHPGRVAALFRAADGRHGKAAWTLLFYALWHRARIEGRPLETDVFASLEAGV